MRKLLGVLVLVCWPLAASAADVSDLVKKLSSKDNEVRRSAAQDLSELGKEASPAINALVKALKDSDRFVRKYAAQALGNIGPDAKSAAKALGGLTNDGNEPVRKAAILALANLGPSAVPELSKAVKGTSSDVQELAIAALGKAGTEGLPALIGVIKDIKIDASMRRRAIEAVVPMGKAARSAVPALTEAVKNNKAKGADAGRFRQDAITALGNLAYKEDTAAVTVLEGFVKDEKLRNNNPLKRLSIAALKKIMARE